ncbi:mycothione reductase [Granulicoccus sp. GXG6511]|uniref:mycothione reductase n=1 Tax=Granulicoccus sp. GXG6511 TaxID=3381351 RepID=UPI003D7D4B56
MPHYDLCVIGSGSGNSLLDERFSSMKVALVDKGINGAFGGTCLNVGCIPTKMFVRPADLATAHAEAARVDVALAPGKPDWPAIRDRIFGRIDAISNSGKDWRIENEHITLLEGEARFTGEKTLGVAGGKLTADRFVIAAGSRPRPFDVEIPEGVTVHTSDTVMRLEKLPRSMVIVGGGFIAAEFAHVFSAYGTRVTIINRSGTLLRREDEDVARRFTRLMSRRVAVRLNQKLASFEPDEDGQILVVTTDASGIEYEYAAEVVLNATGRIPNGDTMNLAAAGVEMDDGGLIVVDEFQRTTADGIFALGDVSSPAQLKHVANHEMRIVQHNLLHPDDLIPANHDAIPHAVFSQPQIAAVGATEQELRESGRRYVKAVQDYGSVAYGWAMEDRESFCKLLADPETGQLLGAHILGEQAPVLIQPLIQAMSFGLGVREMARGQYWIHPALAEVVENALLSLAVPGYEREANAVDE